MASRFLAIVPVALVLTSLPAAAPASVVATAPTLAEPVPGSGGLDFLSAVTLPATVSTPVLGYDVAFTITGPGTGLTITGVDTANHPASEIFPTDPVFSTHIVGGTTVYAFSDFLLAGSGTITPTSILFVLKFHADAGTSGVFNVNFVTDAASPYKSVLYGDANLTPVPTTFQSGSIAFSAVPEPASLGVLGVGGLMLARRVRRRI
ncbi:MAG TPA: PEP-CTERM sorting domain-containing protein [Phycisphaerae bacterium]|jgi:hypothetical protein|nr:PEP-CTERM sorting domain-containing protein [Phycisphaerae bacterium]